MGIAPEMKLVMKSTFGEFVGENLALRPRSFTDSSVRLAPTCEKCADVEPSSIVGLEAIGGVDGKHSSFVNQSATEELKAFLGLGFPRLLKDQFPSCPPGNLCASPCKKSPTRLPLSEMLREEENSIQGQSLWPHAQHGLTTFAAPDCAMRTCWVPVYFAGEPQLQNNVMMLPPCVEKQYIPQQWQYTRSNDCEMQYLPDANSDSLSSDSSEAQDGQQLTPTMTTLILRNVPSNMTRDMLLELLDAQGYASKYDFVYVPIDFSCQAGLGYAFINLVSATDALEFWAHFDGFHQWSTPSAKVCALNWSSPIQGLTAHVDRYKNSPVMHETVPDEWKPAIFSNGKRLCFPPATKSIKAPKIRNNRA